MRDESLIEKTDEIMSAINRFIGIDDVPLELLLSRRIATTRSVILPEEKWKQKNLGPIEPCDKSGALLTENELNYIKINSVSIPNSAL